jgi:beta-lactamase regulating signal transducer with metallopeptidase domain
MIVALSDTEPFVRWLVETGLVVSLLIIGILLIRRPFARWFGANAAYALWCLPLIRICLPVFAIPERWVPTAFRPAAQPAAAIDLAAAWPETVGQSRPNDLTPLLSDPSAVHGAAFQGGGVSILMVILGLWASVAVLWLGYQLYQQRQFRLRLFANSDAPSAALLAEVKSAAGRVALSKSPDVRISHQNLGPFITGVFNPLVVLPQSFETDFNPQQRNFALIHELAHLKRKDLWVACGVLIFRAVNWPNPLVHFASHRLRADQEAACDAYVVKVTGQAATHSYAETLVKAARQTTGNSGKIGQLALSLADTQGDAETEISNGDEI